MPRAIDAVTYRDLVISRRRMVRSDRRDVHLLGLRDLDTGELFVTDARKVIK